MDKVKPFMVAGFGLVALVGAWQWNAGFTSRQQGDPTIALAVSPSPSPALEGSLQAMRSGLTDLRQAAKTGDPEALREAERDIVVPLFDALAATRVDGHVDHAAYMRVVDTVAEVQGLFKEIPYCLEVRPGEGLPIIRLNLRRSPYPVITARTRPLGWHVEVQGDGVILTP